MCANVHRKRLGGRPILAAGKGGGNLADCSSPAAAGVEPAVPVPRRCLFSSKSRRTTIRVLRYPVSHTSQKARWLRQPENHSRDGCATSVA